MSSVTPTQYFYLLYVYHLSTHKPIRVHQVLIHEAGFTFR